MLQYEESEPEALSALRLEAVRPERALFVVRPEPLEWGVPCGQPAEFAEPVLELERAWFLV